MKKIITLISFALAAVILTVSIIYASVNTDDEKLAAYLKNVSFSDTFDEDNAPLSTYNYDRLNENEKLAYISILSSIKGHPEYIRIPDLTEDEFKNVFFSVKNDNPHILCFSDSCSMITYMSASLVQLSYNHTAEDCGPMHEELNARAEEIIKEASDCETDYEKELFVHDYIALNCKYSRSDNDSGAYGCLVAGEAVCSGYARGAMLLLNKLGVESILVGGVGVSPDSGSISHMWNVAWIDGEPYCLDVTWDDPTPDTEGFVSHIYFNQTSEVFAADHLESDPVVDCTSAESNYFTKCGTLFDEYNPLVVKTVAEKLSENIKNGMPYIELMFTTDEAFDDASKYLLETENPDSDMYGVIRFISENAGEDVDASHINISKKSDSRYVRLSFDLK